MPAASTLTSTGPALEPQRADAARNVQRVLDAAVALLATNPQAGMGDVAAAAGVGRATVYRHFATRDALLQAIFEQAIGQAEAAIERCRPEEGTATAALERLIDAWLDVGERYAVLHSAAQRGFVVSGPLRARRERIVGESLVALVRRGQGSGELHPSLPPEWMARVVSGLVHAGVRAVVEGDLDRAEAAAVVRRSLLHGLGGA